MPSLRHILEIFLATFVCSIVFFSELRDRMKVELGVAESVHHDHHHHHHHHHGDYTYPHHSHSHQRPHHHHQKDVLPLRRFYQPPLERDPKETMANYNHQNRSHPDYVKESRNAYTTKLFWFLPEQKSPKETMVAGGKEGRHGRHRKRKDNNGRVHDEDYYYTYKKEDPETVTSSTNPASEFLRDTIEWMKESSGNAAATFVKNQPSFLRGSTVED